MSEDTPVEETADDDAPAAAAGETTATATASPEAPEPGGDVAVQVPDFEPLQDSGNTASDTSVNRFFDVNITVSAELGRVSLPIGELLQLGEGAIVELHRPITGPVDLMAQGVRIAKGEVVVVDDCFAVRIKQIEPPSQSLS